MGIAAAYNFSQRFGIASNIQMQIVRRKVVGAVEIGVLRRQAPS